MSLTLSETEHQPQARIALEAALRNADALSHAYLFHGPSGTGKGAVARAFAADLLASGSEDPDDVRRRVRSGVHPDLAWIEPRGAQILAEDVREQVVAQAPMRPFEAAKRVFVIADADRMNDTSQNALLKTLEEPAPHAVFVLISSAPARLLPTIPSRCRSVRFGPLPPARIAQVLGDAGVDPATATACALLSGGDEVSARLLAGPLAALRSEAEAAARATLREVDDAEWRVAAPWGVLASRAASAAADEEKVEKSALDALVENQPKRGGAITKTEYKQQLKRVHRRAHTASLDRSLELVQLWFRDLVALASGAPEQVFNCDRLDAVAEDAEGREVHGLIDCVALVEETRRHLERNVVEDLALEALFDGLRRAAA